ASKEASGTGNMKFMLNGALTIATFDGANVEIEELVGNENIYTFGRTSEEIVDLYENDGYDSMYYYKKDTIKPLVDFIVSDPLLDIGNKENLMSLIDLIEFIAIKEKVYEDYENEKVWWEKSLVNIAHAGFFSSDRTIEEYNHEIWHLDN